MTPPKPLIAVGLAAVTGCAALPEGAEDLNDEQIAKVEYLVDVANRALPIVIEMTAYMDSGWVNEYGETREAESMAKALETTQKDLQIYWENGLIYAAETEVFESLLITVQAEGIHSTPNNTPKKRTDDYIILNTDMEDDWDPALIVHETGHRIWGHDATIETDLLAIQDLNYINPEVAKTIKKHHDYPYTIGGLLYGPAKIIMTLDRERTDALTEARDALHHGKAYAALYDLKENLAMGNKDEWLTDNAASVFRTTIFQSEYGVTEEDLVTIFNKKGLYETELELRKAMIDEFSKEIEEHMQEIRIPLR